MAPDALVNSDAPSAMEIITGRVTRTQVKYHRWATTDRSVRFGDLFNLVCHPNYVLVAWEHVARNKGVRTAGIDGVTVRRIVRSGQVGAFLAGIAASLNDGTYRPSPVRRVLIPKPGGKSRPLGIPTVTDRVVPDDATIETSREMGTGKNKRTRRLVYHYSFKRRQREERAINAQVAKAEKVAAGQRPIARDRFVTVTADADGKKAEVNWDVIKRARFCAGFKRLCDQHRQDRDGGRPGRQRDLWRIEESFRMTKCDLAARPVFQQQQL